MLHGTDLQRVGRRNTKAGELAADENAISPTHGNNKNDSRKQPLLSTATNKPMSGDSRRVTLNDKSNRYSRTLSTMKTSNTDNEKQATISIRQQPEHDHTQLNPPSQQADTTTTTTTTSSITSQQRTCSVKEPEMAAAATEAANLKDFFEDNKKRYKAKSTEEGRQRMQPTPILPILVSDRMKAYLRERYLSIGAKRPLEVQQQVQRLTAIPKRQKSGHRSVLDRHDDQNDHSGDKENVDPNAHPTSAKYTSKSAEVIPSTTTTSLPISSQSAPSLHPSFASLQTKDYKHPDIQLDQQTYDEAEKLEQSQDRRAQENLLQQNQVQEQSDKETDISNDPMLVAEYADEIFKYLRSTEKTMLADPSYITIQHEVTWRMRAVLIDWVIEIHYIFQLLPETLFLAVNIIDRFLSRRDVSLSKLQLVGIASLFVATKFEETTSPPIKQYLFMTGDAVSEEDLLRSERYILQILDFKLCYPNPLHFLRRSTMTGNFDLHIRLLAKYFMEITLIDHRFLDTPPSQTAAASLWLATKMLCKGSWTPELAKASGYTPLEIKPTVELMLEYLSQPVTDDSFFKKWSSRRMMKVSIFVRDWVQRFYTDS